MKISHKNKSFKIYIQEYFVIALIYAVLGAMSYLVMPDTVKSVPIWFPTGFALAVLIKRGLHYFPSLIIGSLFSLVSIALLQTGEGLDFRQFYQIISGRNFGTLAESFLGAWLILRYMEQTSLYRSVYQTVIFSFFTALSAIAGSLAVCMVEAGILGNDLYWQQLISFWASGFISMMLVSPMILAWETQVKIFFDKKKNFELIAASSVLALVIILTFGARGIPEIQFSLLYLMIPVILWILYRFNHRYGMVAVTIVVFNIMAATNNGIGAISVIDPINRILVMQLYIAVLVLILMLVGSYIGERHQFKTQLFDLNSKLDNIIIEKTEKLERTEERFGNIFNTSPLGIELFDKNGDLVDANETALKLFGIKSIVDVLSYNFLQDEYADPALISRLVNGADVKFEFWYNFDSEYRPQRFPSTREGRIYLQVMINVIRDSLGEHFAYVALIQDMTERKLAENQVLRSEERLAEIQRLANLGSWEYHIRRKEFSISKEAAAIAGLENLGEDVSIDSYLSSIYDEDRLKFEEKFNSAVEEGTPFEMELRHVGCKNEIYYTITRVHPLSRNDRIREIIGSVFDITKQKQTEQALRKSENTFKTIFSQSPLGILLFDNDGKIIDLNPATLGIFGIIEIDSVKDFNLFDNILIRVEDRGGLDLGNRLRFTTEVDFEDIRKSGDYDSIRHGIAYIEVEITAIRSLGYLAQVRDMSREYTAELAIRENEERLRTIFDNAGMGISILDTELKYIDCNNQWLAMVGYERKELMDKEFTVLTHPDDLSKSRSQLQKIVNNTLSSYTMEKRYIRKDGTIMWGSLSVTPIKDPRGHTISIIGIIVDITRRKEIELRLKDSEQFLRRVIDTSPNPIFVKNWEGEFTLANKAIAELLGTSVDEMLGKRDEDFLPSLKEAEQFLNDDREVMETRKLKVISEETLTSGDGSVKWLKTIKVPLDDRLYGTAKHVLGVSTDITELKMAEQKLIEMATHDSLTQLPNRRHFYEKLQEVLARSKRQEKYLAVLFIDLDGFKEVNDRLGHDAGDELLKLVAEQLILSVREVDIVSRLGGDEFTVILESVVNDEDIIHVTERIIENVDTPFDIGGEEARVTASVGVSVYPRDGENMEELVKKADDAMYISKKNGKNMFTFYQDEFKEEG